MSKKPKRKDRAFIKAAQLKNPSRDIRISDDAEVLSHDKLSRGTWVEAWIWVTKAEIKP